VVGEAGDGQAALLLATTLQPAVVVMDIEMPGMDGLSATALLRERNPASAVVILSMYDDAPTRKRAKQAGAVAVVGKHETTETLLAIIRQAAHGFPTSSPAD
jgi:DNA-binding NarL/FixJ family response regulator